MNNKEYWRKRSEILEDALTNAYASKLTATVEGQFNLAQKTIDEQIEQWYGRFAKNNEITLVEARQWLTGKDLAEFKWDVNEYIKYGKDAGLDPAFVKQLENASARFHISKLEALKIKTQNTVEQLYGHMQMQTNDLLGNKIFKESYYHNVFQIQQGFGVGWNIAAVNPDVVESVLSKPWTLDKETFSDRIWTQKQSLIDEVHTRLTQNMILGKSPDEAISAIAKKFNTSKANAGRLIMTESAYFASEAQLYAYATLDVEEFEIVATLDGSTCGICGEFDGEHSPIIDFEPGVTAPPFHPWCRCCTAPYFSDDEGERFARGEDGEGYYIPQDMKYQDWKDKFVDKPEKDGIIDITEGGKYEQLKTAEHFNGLAASQDINAEEAAQIWKHGEKGELGYIRSPEGYKAINQYLREQVDTVAPEHKLTLDTLDAVTQRNALPDNYMGMRKVTSKYLFDVMGIDVSNSEWYDYFNYDDKANAELAVSEIKKLIGKSYLDKAFTSFSMVEDLRYEGFDKYPVKFTTQMPKGTKGLITNNTAESEFISARGSKLEILGADLYHPDIYKGDEKYYINIYAKLVN